MLSVMAPLALCVACAGDPLRLYSPAAGDPMLAYNNNVVETLNQCDPTLDAGLIAVALPDSINQFAEVAPSEKASHWPIVTIVDFLPAVQQSGPDWHGFDRKNDDLLMVSALYDVGWGVIAFDPTIQTPDDLRGKRIAVPHRPSSLRVIIEAQLRDGWDILDDVILVDTPPNRVVDAVEAGDVDATFWNGVMSSPTGYLPMFPSLSETGHWIDVDDEAVSAINTANGFDVSTVAIQGDDGPRLISFRQGLAAWRSTDDTMINEALTCLSQNAGTLPGLPDSVDAMRYWPGMTKENLHPAARAFYDRGQIP